MSGAADLNVDVPARADVAELRQPGVEQRLGTFIVLHGEAVDGSRANFIASFFAAELSQENIDPKGPREAEYRTLRGGGWFDDPDLVSASNWSWFEDGDTDYNVGFP